MASLHFDEGLPHRDTITDVDKDCLHAAGLGRLDFQDRLIHFYLGNWRPERHGISRTEVERADFPGIFRIVQFRHQDESRHE